MLLFYSRQNTSTYKRKVLKASRCCLGALLPPQRQGAVKGHAQGTVHQQHAYQ